MKVLHLNTNQQGGAAWCAIRISKALAKAGVDSRMLFAQGEQIPEGIEGAIAKKDKSFWERNYVLRGCRWLLAQTPWYVDYHKQQVMMDRANTEHLYLHQPLSLYTNIANHPLVEWADIIHLHWVPAFVDYPTFFEKVKKPIVWTLHDKYPAVGALHSCSEFSPVPCKLQPIDRQFRTIKRKGIEKAYSMHIVAISEMMMGICQSSDVLKGFPVCLIHNGVDTNVFRPFDKQKSRIELGLSLNSKIVLFSSYWLHDKNKGLDRLIDAMGHIDCPNMQLVCIGTPLVMPRASFQIKQTGLLTDQTIIAKYYSAADLFVQCSYEESFGQTLLEAMSCGTPVVSTPCGIAKELIYPFNGILCKGYKTEDIAFGIKEGLSTKYDSVTIREYIVNHFQYEIIAKQYINLYTKILDGN